MSESKLLAKELIKYSNYGNFKRSGGSKEGYYKWMTEKKVRLLDKYDVHMDESCMALIIYRYFLPEQVRPFSKVIPASMDWEEDIERVLDAQSWCCI